MHATYERVILLFPTYKTLAAEQIARPFIISTVIKEKRQEQKFNTCQHHNGENEEQDDVACATGTTYLNVKFYSGFRRFLIMELINIKVR